MKHAFYILTLLVVFASCGDGVTANNNKPTEVHTVSPERTNPKPEPVATFSENVTTEIGRLNNWKFAVVLYETSKTFTYRIQVQYAELNITDSLQLPNLGLEPKPALQKGKDEYSCIIGFMDDKNVFREYKSVTVTNGNVRIHTLKYYSVQRSTQ